MRDGVFMRATESGWYVALYGADGVAQYGRWYPDKSEAAIYARNLAQHWCYDSSKWSIAAN